MKRGFVGLAGLALAAAGGWAILGGGDGTVAGAGVHGADLVLCQDYIWEMVQHPESIDFPDAAVWHRPDERGLRVGGVLSVLNIEGRREGFDYACTIRGGRIVNGDIF